MKPARTCLAMAGRLGRLASATLVIVLLGLPGCCSCGGCGGCGTKTSSHVGSVPTTLEEVRKQHAPPEVVVKVERITKSTGSFRCAHPVCLIVLPIVLVSALFPP